MHARAGGGPPRPRPWRAAAALLALLVAAASAALAGDVRVHAVDSIGMTVSDADRSIDFYSRVLGFAVVRDVEVSGDAYERLRGVFPVRMRVVRMRLGDEVLELTEYVTPRGRPPVVDSRSNDRWFQHVAIVVSDMDRAYGWLRRQRVMQVSPEPQRLPESNPAAGGIRAFYFRDPDGHPLELIWFPAGKGDPRWQAPTERVFLGIDHTAIAVADTDASVAFYRDRLGLRVAGESRNSGPEQERLNAVRGARLRITGLRAPAGPGIELLEYLVPRDGRPAPADLRANDLTHWRTRLVADRGAAIRRLDRAMPVELPADGLGFARAASVHDPDGHVLEVVEP
jgi:catechol 2,3-dioxygenase-like lactoylglutathione lyase family enzyme